MIYEPILPRHKLETLYTFDGDPVVAPKGGKIRVDPDGDMIGIPKDGQVCFTLDGDLYVRTPDGKTIDYRVKSL